MGFTIYSSCSLTMTALAKLRSVAQGWGLICTMGAAGARDCLHAAPGLCRDILGTPSAISILGVCSRFAGSLASPVSIHQGADALQQHTQKVRVQSGSLKGAFKASHLEEPWRFSLLPDFNKPMNHQPSSLLTNCPSRYCTYTA